MASVDKEANLRVWVLPKDKKQQPVWGTLLTPLIIYYHNPSYQQLIITDHRMVNPFVGGGYMYKQLQLDGNISLLHKFIMCFLCQFSTGPSEWAFLPASFLIYPTSLSELSPMVLSMCTDHVLIM